MKEARAGNSWTTRIIKAGALLQDSRTFLGLYRPDRSPEQNLEGFLYSNAFGKTSRSRVQDILPIFRRRFLARPALLPSLVHLVANGAEPEILDRVLYYHAARADGLLYDFAVDFLFPRRTSGGAVILGEVSRFLSEGARAQGLKWRADTLRRVARGLLATLRDFRILEGAAKKRIAPAHLPLEVLLYVAFALHLDGAAGEQLLAHPHWRLYMMQRNEIEPLFLEAHRRKWLDFQVAGRLARVEFRVKSPEDMARAIARREN